MGARIRDQRATHKWDFALSEGILAVVWSQLVLALLGVTVAGVATSEEARLGGSVTGKSGIPDVVFVLRQALARDERLHRKREDKWTAENLELSKALNSLRDEIISEEERSYVLERRWTKLQAEKVELTEEGYYGRDPRQGDSEMRNQGPAPSFLDRLKTESRTSSPPAEPSSDSNH